MSQKTLTGEGEPVRRECEHLGPCGRPAVNEVHAFLYDGGGWVYRWKAACESCTDEFLEPKNKTREDDVRRLKPSERWASVSEKADKTGE
jgi:hypothetical protein